MPTNRDTADASGKVLKSCIIDKIFLLFKGSYELVVIYPVLNYVSGKGNKTCLHIRSAKCCNIISIGLNGYKRTLLFNKKVSLVDVTLTIHPPLHQFTFGKRS